MSQAPLPLLKNIKRIEIVLDSNDSVKFKNGVLECHLRPVNFRFAEHLLWEAILKDVDTKGLLTTLNAATCRSKGRKR